MRVVDEGLELRHLPAVEDLGAGAEELGLLEDVEGRRVAPRLDAARPEDVRGHRELPPEALEEVAGLLVELLRVDVEARLDALEVGPKEPGQRKGDSTSLQPGWSARARSEKPTVMLRDRSGR